MSLANHLTVITTPSSKWLKDNLERCEQRFWAASPFVTGFLREATKDLPESRERRLVTSTDIRIFINKASDLDALEQLETSGFALKSVHRLHAKAYVIDEKAALVTSANATHSGMYHNRECGLATNDPGLVREIAAQIESGFGADNGAQKIERSDLSTMRGLVEQFRAQRATVSMQGFAEDEPPPFVLQNSGEEHKLLSQFSGWTALTFEAVLSLNLNVFTLDQLESACLPMASKNYPENNNVRAKLRQQLQTLRDLGFIEFLGGSYKLLVERGL